MENLKQKTVSGIMWSAIERFSLQGVQFIIQIILARLLLPSDYGMIGMLAIFLQVAQVFIDSGFTNALIQKKDRTEEDFATVFYFNILVAVLFYGILFFSASLIADFYNMPTLVLVIRFIALSLIINALSAIHRTKLIISVNFKTQSKISLGAAFISGVIGIWMAYVGCGVWALVWQTLLNSIILTILFYCLVHWKPLHTFSKSSFERLFNFGSKLLISSLINTVYRNLYTIVIGKKFSVVELGYYTRAEQFAIFPSNNLNALVSRVAYPILSSIQDDDKCLTNAYRNYIRLSSYIIFPLMVGLLVLANPIISLLLTDKWSGVVILLQILCLDWMFDHLSQINLNLLWVKGRSDLSLRLEIIKKTIAIFILFVSIPFGLEVMCWGRVIYSLIATYLNTYYTNSLIDLTLKLQVKDVFPSLILSFIMGGIVFICISFFETDIVKIVIGCITGMSFYILLSFLFKLDSFFCILTLIIKTKNIDENIIKDFSSNSKDN